MNDIFKKEKIDVIEGLENASGCLRTESYDRYAEYVDAGIAEILRLRAENEKLREALAAERERCAKIAEQARDDTCDGPVAWSMADSIAAAIRESGNE